MPRKEKIMDKNVEKKPERKTEPRAAPRKKVEPTEKAPVEQKNVVFIGAKPTMNYALATLTQFNQGSDEVVLKARGRATSRAVDVAEVVRKRFLNQMLSVKDIKIGTDSVGESGNLRNVSTIEITLTKNK